MRVLRWLLWVLEHPAVGVYGCPVLIGAGVYFAVTGPEWWEDWFLGTGLGWLITSWVGSGFAFMWWMVRRGAVELPGGEVAAAVAGLGAIVLVAGVGVFTEPYLFGVAVWPGLAMLGAGVTRRLERPRDERSERDKEGGGGRVG